MLCHFERFCCLVQVQSLRWNQTRTYHSDLGLGMMLKGGGTVAPSSK